jgi:hypothetical protein
VNQSEAHHEFLHEVKQHLQLLKHAGLEESVYFPRLLVVNKIFLLFEMILKALWWISGGWIWRLTRKFIYSKLRTDTFQGPTSLGAAMVLMPLVALILLLVCWFAHIPLQLWLSWLIFLMWGKSISGSFIPDVESIYCFRKNDEDYAKECYCFYSRS